MTILETAKVTSKGQVTIPNRIRKILHLKEGTSIAFGIDEHGVIIMPCKITTESPYTAKEWAKIEELAAAKGKTYKNIEEARKHIQSL
jgi:AbrB family looped-hinge helix DNA binding protein